MMKICARAYRNQTTFAFISEGEALYYARQRLKKRIQLSLRKEAKSEVVPRAFGWRWLTVGLRWLSMLLIGLVIWESRQGVIRPFKRDFWLWR